MIQFSNPARVGYDYFCRAGHMLNPDWIDNFKYIWRPSELVRGHYFRFSLLFVAN
jgi:hypothetical protein